MSLKNRPIVSYGAVRVQGGDTACGVIIAPEKGGEPAPMTLLK